MRMIIIGMLIFLLCACGGGNSPSIQTSDGSSPSNSSDSTPSDGGNSSPQTPQGQTQHSYYISDSVGSDSYTAEAAQNQLTPWKSLNKISGVVVDGDSVFLKKGDTWTNQTLATTVSGVTFAAYGTGEKPIVTGPGAGGYAFKSVSHANTVVDGIEFRNADAAVMYIASDSATMKNCKIVGTGSTDADGIRVETNGNTLSHILIGGKDQGNEITAAGIGIILVPGNPEAIYDVEISYNNIHDCGLEGIKTYGPTSIYTRPYGINISYNTLNNIGTRAIWVQGGWQNVAGHSNYIGHNTATNIGSLSTPNVNAFQLNYIDTAIIEYNTITNVYTSIPDGDGIELDKAWATSGENLSTNLTVRYNIVSGCNSGGDSQSAGISAVACTNSKIYYNIVHHNHIGISHSTQYTTGNSFYNNVMDSNNYGALRGDYYEHVGPPDSTWKNNIISNSAICGFILDQWSSGPSESYNLWYNNPENIYKNTVGSIPVDSTDIVNDPLFLGSGDYHLNSGSPAAFVGTNVGLTSDFDGNPVPKNTGGKPSIGAYEP